MLTIVRGIDRLSQGVGVTVRWFFAAAMVISAGSASSRRVFGASSNAFLELQWYLFAAAVLLGASYVLLKDAHVRVDFISSKLSPRTNAVFDALALMLVAISFCVMLIKYSWPMFEIACRTSAYAGSLKHSGGRESNTVPASAGYWMAALSASRCGHSRGSWASGRAVGGGVAASGAS